MNPFLSSVSKNSSLLSNSSNTQPTMEEIKDVAILNPLLSGQVLVFNGSVWQNIVPQSLMNDTLWSLLDVSIGSLVNDQVLTCNTSNTKWENSTISESQITNLTTNLSNCEKSQIKVYLIDILDLM